MYLLPLSHEASWSVVVIVDEVEKSLGDEDKLGKSFGGEVESGKIMVSDDEWWMVMFVATFFFFSSSLESLSLDSHSSPR